MQKAGYFWLNTNVASDTFDQSQHLELLKTKNKVSYMWDTY